MTTKSQQAEIEHAKSKLVEMVKPGDTVYTVLRHVSRSGMSRSIDLQTEDHSQISYFAAQAMQDKIDRDNGGIKIGGCGMDMGFALVYNLSHALFSGGFGCIGKGCPSSDHSNGDHNYDEHCEGYDKNGQPNGITCQRLSCGGSHWHTSGGYALRHRWI